MAENKTQNDYYTEEDKAAAIAYAVENGFPPLGLWNMPQFTPNLIRAFVDKEKLVNGFAMQYLSPMDRQVIYCVISAANNCEMCLSFHAAGLLQSKYITPSDLTLMIHGGLPTDEQLRPIAVAAKYCHSHKGILLEREKAHLAALGVSEEKYGEINFYAGQIYANNLFMVHLVSEGVPVEEMLQAVGPFRDTVYAPKDPLPADEPVTREAYENVYNTQDRATEHQAAIKETTDAGFPALGVFSMTQFSPNVLRAFVQKEVILNKAELLVPPLMRQVIYTIVSAANNCEMCLCFHAAGCLKAEFVTPEDMKLMVDGGLPQSEEHRKYAVAAKYAIAHKGILLKREKAFLAKLGVDPILYAEILFWCGVIHANNMFMVYLINEGCPVEEMLRAVGPFAGVLEADAWEN